VALEGLRDWASVESSGDGKVAGPVMCRLRLWSVVPPRVSLERTRIDEREAHMVLRLYLIENNGKLDVGTEYKHVKFVCFVRVIRLLWSRQRTGVLVELE